MSVFATMFFLILTFHWQAQVFAKVQELFKDAPDLAAAFATSNLAIPEGQARDLGIRDADGLVSLFKVMNISEPSEEGD